MNKPSTPSWLPSKPLDRGNAAEQILQGLRAQILDGQFPRGAKLPSEKQLAEGYGVSGATIREAIRGLTTTGLVEVRHGSGAYVTADVDQLIDTPLRSMIQMERIGVSEVLGVLGALNAYAAELATVHATREDLDRMRQALDAIDKAQDAQAISAGLSAFIAEWARASGNPLLGVLCRFLGSLQIGLARELCSDSLANLQKTVRGLSKERQQLVDAIEARDAQAARTAARIYHECAIKVITALPRADATFVSDPTLSSLLAAAGGQPPQSGGV